MKNNDVHEYIVYNKILQYSMKNKNCPFWYHGNFKVIIYVYISMTEVKPQM